MRQACAGQRPLRGAIASVAATACRDLTATPPARRQTMASAALALTLTLALLGTLAGGSGGQPGSAFAAFGDDRSLCEPCIQPYTEDYLHPLDGPANSPDVADSGRSWRQRLCHPGTPRVLAEGRVRCDSIPNPSPMALDHNASSTLGRYTTEIALCDAIAQEFPPQLDFQPFPG